jgi:hypothetical protein
MIVYLGKSNCGHPKIQMLKNISFFKSLISILCKFANFQFADLFLMPHLRQNIFLTWVADTVFASLLTKNPRYSSINSAPTAAKNVYPAEHLNVCHLRYAT